MFFKFCFVGNKCFTKGEKSNIFLGNRIKTLRERESIAHGVWKL